MKKIFLILIVLLNTTFCFSQAYIPTLESGKTWHIVKPMGLGNFSFHHFKIDCDTNINSYNYKKAYSCDTMGNKQYFMGFFREDISTQKIYEFVNGFDSLIIDYQFQAGDTIAGMDVDSVTNEFVFGQNRKVIYFDVVYKWIEGIGSSFFGLKPILGGLNIYSNVYGVNYTDNTCIPLNIIGIENNTIEFSQNNNVINFQSNNNNQKKVNIYNNLGQIIYQTKFVNFINIDLSAHEKGMLFFEVLDNEFRKVWKVIN